MYQFVLLQIGIPTRISKIQFKISREPKNQNQLFHLAIHGEKPPLGTKK